MQRPLKWGSTVEIHWPNFKDKNLNELKAIFFAKFLIFKMYV